MRVEDIVSKVFARSFMGYDIEQVDLFLDEVIERFEQYESEKREMLLAMEYLLNKLENGQKLPIAEMKKAIDTGKSQKKHVPQDGRTAETVAQAAREAKGQPAPLEPENSAETKQAARSIARGAQTPKPVRAPKVARVKVSPEAETIQEAGRPEPVGKADKPYKTPVQPRQQEPAPEAKLETPVAKNWLDELLVNLIEREKAGREVPPDAGAFSESGNREAAPQDGDADRSAQVEEENIRENAESEASQEESDRV